MRYTLLGNSGLRVSEVALGTMTFGTDWGWGASTGESAKQFELFAEAGGTLIDTANKYTNGTAESILGDLLATDRDHFVVGTGTRSTSRQTSTLHGNHRRAWCRHEASLQRLRTDHVDIPWLHAWDHLTPPEEVMRAPDDQEAGRAILSPGTLTPRLCGGPDNPGRRPRLVHLRRPTGRVLSSSARSSGLIPMARGLGLGVLARTLGAESYPASTPTQTPTAERRIVDVDAGRPLSPGPSPTSPTVLDSAPPSSHSPGYAPRAASSRSSARGPPSNSPTTSPAWTSTCRPTRWPGSIRPATSLAASRTTSWPAPTSSSVACPAS